MILQDPPEVQVVERCPNDHALRRWGAGKPQSLEYRNGPPRPHVCLFYPGRTGQGILEWRSRGEAFTSAEVRPLASVWPLRFGPQSLLRLEAPTSYHKLPPGPMSREGLSRLFPTQSLFRRPYVCHAPNSGSETDRQYDHTHRRGHRHLAVWPLRRLPCATTSSSACRRRTVLRRIRQRLLPVPCASRRVGRPPPRRLLHHPPGCRRSLRRQSPALPAPPRRLGAPGRPPRRWPVATSPSPAATRCATKTTAPPSSPPASPTPSRHRAPRARLCHQRTGPPAHQAAGRPRCASCARRPRALQAVVRQRTRLTQPGCTICWCRRSLNWP